MVHHISNATSEIRVLKEKDRKYKVKINAEYNKMMKKLNDPLFIKRCKIFGLGHYEEPQHTPDKSLGIVGLIPDDVDDLIRCAEQYEPYTLEEEREEEYYSVIEFYEIKYRQLMDDLKWFNKTYDKVYTLLELASSVRKESVHNKMDRRVDHHHGLSRTRVAQHPTNMHGYSNTAPRRVSRKSGLRRIEHSIRKMI